MSLSIASIARRLMSSGAEKSGKPCDRLTAPYFIASRVISRITDSVNRLALRDTCRLFEIEGVVMVFSHEGLKSTQNDFGKQFYGMICSPAASRFNCSRIERIAAA